MDLQGKVGVILGVANERSIAWGIAKAISDAGGRVALNYQNERMEANVQKLADQLNNAVCYPCDLTDDDQIDAFFERVGREFGGKLDFMVHSVAFAKREDLDGRYMDTSRDGFALALEISAYSLVAATRRAFPLMKAAGGGSIMTLSFYGAEKAVINYNVMGVAKSALESSVRYLALDLGPDNIRVNAISAGAVRTLAARGISDFNKLLSISAERAPMKRNISQEEVGQTAVFLASDGSTGITGETLYVDAGYHITAL